MKLGFVASFVPAANIDKVRDKVCDEVCLIQGRAGKLSVRDALEALVRNRAASQRSLVS